MTADADDRPRVVDYLCNAFSPDRAVGWRMAVERAGIPLKLHDHDGDGFCDATDMVARMDELGIATVCLPTGDPPDNDNDPCDFEHLSCTWDETAELAECYPGRFAALALIDPSHGYRAVGETRAHLSSDWVVGLYLHTHSWDRRLDHADLYPWYALATDHGLPVCMQVGSSGGLLPSECGHPIGIDRVALYFRDTTFVLSHTGWPWVDEAVAMALKFPNVYLGTASYPPRHWSSSVTNFLRGPGRRKVLYGSNFPTTAHRQGIEQVDELGLDPATRDALLGGTARRVFGRLADPGATT